MKWRRPLLWISGSLVAFVALALVSAYAFLRSPAGSRWLLAEIKEYIEKDPAQRFEFSEGRIDPFSSLSFKNLKLIRVQDGLRAEVTVENLELRFEFSVFPRRLLIERFLVERPRVKLEIEDRAEGQAPAARNSGRTMDDLVIAPPAEVILRSVVVRDLDLAVEIRSARGTQSLGASGLSLVFDFEMLAKRLAGKGNLDSKQGLSWKSTDSRAQGAVQASALVYPAANWEFSVSREGDSWLYRLSPSRIRLKVDRFEQASRALAVSEKISLAASELFFDGGLQARSKALFQVAGNDVESLDLKLVGDVGRFGSEQTAAARTTRTSVESQKLEASARLNDTIELSVEHHLSRASMPGVFSRPVTVLTRLKARTPRDLASAEATATVSLEGKPLVALRADSQQGRDEWVLKGDLDFDVGVETAKSLASAQALAKMAPLKAKADFEARSLKGGALSFSLRSQAPVLKVPTFKSPVALEFGARGKWDRVENRFDIEADSRVRQAEYGDWSLKSAFDLVLDKPDMAPERRGGMRTKGQSEITQERRGIAKVLPIALEKPVVISHDLNKDGRERTRVSGEVRVLVPTLSVDGFARATETDLRVGLTTPDANAARDLDIRIEAKQGEVRFESEQAAPPIAGLDLKARANLRDGVVFNLEELRATIDRSALVLEAQATGNLREKDARAELELGVAIPENFPDIQGHRVRGRMSVPTSIAVFGGRDVSIGGRIIFENASWSKGAGGLSGLSGALPFSEKLRWNGRRLAFASLISQNPFERVDFERVRPLLEGADPIRIERLSWEERAFGPFVGFFSLRQNMLFAHQFDMDLGAGRVYGEMFFDMLPKQLRFGMLSRLTTLDLGEILPARYLRRVPSGEKKVSGRSGLVIDLARSSVDGRVDITEIGAPQLVALINLIDPQFEDEKMNRVRRVLELGFPTSVGLAFAEGYMNMDIALSLLGIPKRESVREIPISSLLSSATSGLVKRAKEGPIE